MNVYEEAELCFPQLLNSSCRRTPRPLSESKLTHILLSSISLLTVTLNLLVIISISHFKQLHTTTNLLLLSLAVADFFVGFLISFQIVFIDGCWFLGDSVCVLYYVLDYITTSVSVGTMVLISVDRYVAICDPLHYPTKMTQKTVKVCVCLCWIWSACYNGLLLQDNLERPGRYNSCYGECIVIINYFAGLTDVFLSFICPVTVIVVLYMRVFVVAASQARVMQSHIAAVTLQRSVTTNKSNMKAARTLGVVIVVFLLCLCPYFCVTLAGPDTLLVNVSSVTFVCLFYFNSCLNPLIYAFYYPWFRKSIKLVVTLKILQPGSCDTNML